MIVDTAGRLQIDDRLMGELAAARKAISPTDTLLVVDAMTGQEAATLVRSFNEAAPITGGSAGAPLSCLCWGMLYPVSIGPLVWHAHLHARSTAAAGPSHQLAGTRRC